MRRQKSKYFLALSCFSIPKSKKKGHEQQRVEYPRKSILCVTLRPRALPFMPFLSLSWILNMHLVKILVPFCPFVVVVDGAGRSWNKFKTNRFLLLSLTFTSSSSISIPRVSCVSLASPPAYSTLFLLLLPLSSCWSFCSSCFTPAWCSCLSTCLSSSSCSSCLCTCL